MLPDKPSDPRVSWYGSFLPIFLLIPTLWSFYGDVINKHSCNIGDLIVIGHYFCSYFRSIFQPNFTSHSLPHLSPSYLSCYVFLFMPFTLMNRQQEHNLIGLLVTNYLIYWATDIPKQSYCGSSSTQSCAGASSTTTEHCRT